MPTKEPIERELRKQPREKFEGILNLKEMDDDLRQCHFKKWGIHGYDITHETSMIPTHTPKGSTDLGCIL